MLNLGTYTKILFLQISFITGSCPDNKFQPISSVLLSGMMKLISETKDDTRLRSLAYVAVGKIVRRAPQLVKKDIGLAQKLFDAIGQVILILHLTRQKVNWQNIFRKFA